MEVNGLVRGGVVNGDCLKVLREVPAGTFDTIMFDWPYSQGSPVRGKDDGAAARVYGPISFLIRALQQLHRVAKTGCHLYVFGDWKGIPDTGFSLSLSGWFPTTIISWDKCYVGTGGTWRSGWDPIFFATKGPADKRTEKAYSNSLHIPAVRQNKDHPYEKPPELWERLGEVSIPKGSLVLDPFAGSRSSQKPVEAFGASWYGIDIDPAYAVSQHESSDIWDFIQELPSE